MTKANLAHGLGETSGQYSCHIYLMLGFNDYCSVFVDDRSEATVKFSDTTDSLVVKGVRGKFPLAKASGCLLYTSRCV